MQINQRAHVSIFTRRGIVDTFLLFLFSEFNRDSDVIAVQCTFKYKGNTKRTKKMRGRTKDALPALPKN
jgi:hypothetical protein